MMCFSLSVVLFFLSISVAINVTLPLVVWCLLDESIYVTSETTASVGRSDGAKFTVLLCLASNFSKAEVSQTLWRICVRRVVSWVRQVAYWTLSHNGESSVTSCSASSVRLRQGSEAYRLVCLAIFGRLASWMLMR